MPSLHIFTDIIFGRHKAKASGDEPDDGDE
jgi:hypothetical protein